MHEHELRSVEVDDGTLAQMTGLLQVAFPGAAHFTKEVLHWQYKENPDGAAVGFNAWHGEELAGHYVTIPLEATVNGSTEKGLLSLNTATHPAHQGKGLFTKLATATYERAADEGYGFVVGVANANSTHGFIRKLGFGLVSPLRAMIGMGPLPLGTSAQEPQFAHAWGPASIAWRLRHPAYSYSIKEERGHALILSRRRQYGARYVLGVRELPLSVAGIPQEKGSVRRKVWIGLDPAMHWGGTLYVNIPMRFRPSPLNLIFKDLTGKNRQLDPARVRFDAMDFDIL
jgi:GNAT superfamily N-acetyltransferase